MPIGGRRKCGQSETALPSISTWSFLVLCSFGMLQPPYWILGFSESWNYAARREVDVPIHGQPEEMRT